MRFQIVSWSFTYIGGHSLILHPQHRREFGEINVVSICLNYNKEYLCATKIKFKEINFKENIVNMSGYIRIHCSYVVEKTKINIEIYFQEKKEINMSV